MGDDHLRRRRVLQVCAVDFTAYHLLRPLLHGLRDNAWDVEFACADGPFAARLRSEGFRHRVIPISRKASPVHQLVAVAALAVSLVRDRPDLLHTHTPVGGLVGRAAAALARIPAVHTFHGLPLKDPSRPTPIERVFIVAERILARGTRVFFSQARGDVDTAVTLGFASRDRTIVVGNGVDIDRFAPDESRRAKMRAGLGLDEASVLVITVARLVLEKGLLDLADAAYLLASDSRVHFAIVGAALPSDRTDVTAELSRHAAAGSGHRWQLLGHRSDVDALLQAADIFVLPSYREGLPRSIIEAMASALPIIATDIPACRELVDPGENGLLVTAGDVSALADAIRRLAEDPTSRRRLGARSRALAIERHDERTIVALQAKELDRLVPR